MLVRRLLVLAPLALSALMGCGDIGRVVLDVGFATEDLELRTRGLEVVVRDVGTPGTGCGNLWVQTPTGLDEDRNFIVYPNRVDIRASAVDLEKYPLLTLMVYAHPSTDVNDEGAPTSAAIAGGCVEQTIDATKTTSVTISLDPAP